MPVKTITKVAIGILTPSVIVGGYILANKDAWIKAGSPIPSYLMDDLAPHFTDIDLTKIVVIPSEEIPFATNVTALCLGDYILVKPWVWEMEYKDQLMLLAHELTHTRQWKREGFWFPLLYLAQMLQPHESRPFEIEATRVAQEVAGY